MSYATYLRNKADSRPKILSLHKPTDASQHITKKRFKANQTFFTDGEGKGSLAMDTSRPAGTPLLQHQATSYPKKSSRPADASAFTSYRGGQGVNDDAKYLGGGKIEIDQCCQIETPDASKYKTASDIIREKLACDTSNALLSPPLFVDNTIRLSAMHPKMVEDGCCERPISEANHTHSEGIHPPVRPIQAITQHTFMAAPPEFQNKGVGGSRIGAYYTPKSGYVENKHGNDLRVNPRRTPGPWVYSPGAPAHLKINRPTLFNIKPLPVFNGVCRDPPCPPSGGGGGGGGGFGPA